MSNLPPGCSVSDLPGNERPEPECHVCGAPPCREAMEDGFPLCNEHDVAVMRRAYDYFVEEMRKQREAELEQERMESYRGMPDEEREKREQALADRYRGDNAE